jgi:hypothetical protein
MVVGVLFVRAFWALRSAMLAAQSDYAKRMKLSEPEKVNDV